MRTMVRYNPYELLNISPFGLLDSIFENDTAFGLDSRLPAVDVRETDKAFVVEAELPGLTEKDIDLKVERGILVINASKEEDKKSGNKESICGRSVKRGNSPARSPCPIPPTKPP